MQLKDPSLTRKERQSRVNSSSCDAQTPRPAPRISKECRRALALRQLFLSLLAVSSHTCYDVRQQRTYRAGASLKDGGFPVAARTDGLPLPHPGKTRRWWHGRGL